jgi:hypothetical protein
MVQVGGWFSFTEILSLASLAAHLTHNLVLNVVLTRLQDGSAIEASDVQLLTVHEELPSQE